MEAGERTGMLGKVWPRIVLSPPCFSFLSAFLDGALAVAGAVSVASSFVMPRTDNKE